MTTIEGVRTSLVAIAILGPFAYALFWARGGTRADFIYNSGKTGLTATVAGIICGNIGVGTFIGIGLFSMASPVIGVSIAFSYALGLLLCAIVAPLLRKISERHRVHGLIDLLVVVHGIRTPVLVWLPIAFVFLLRATVQLLALATLLQLLLGGSMALVIVLAATATGSYTAIGGYRVAVRTDVLQAGLIIAGIATLATAAPEPASQMEHFFDLGSYKWPLLAGIWLFMPISAVLAVDNWQRIVTARDRNTARIGYLVAAPLCLACYLLIAWLGMSGEFSGDVAATLRKAMPENFGWLADVMLIAVIMSTIDTFVMPLLGGLERTNWSLRRLQVVVVALFALLALAAIILGNLLEGIIAAFSALVAFLPAVAATMISDKPNPISVVISLNAGVLSTLGFIAIDLNTAAFVGLVVAAIPFAASTGQAIKGRCAL